MPYTPPWLNPPDFLGASEAGVRLGLSRQEMLQQAEEHAAQLAVERDRIAAENSVKNAELQKRQQQNSAANALREQAINQAGILGTDRNKNQADSISARESLDEAKRNKPTLINTGNGLFKFDPATGQTEKVPGSTKPQTELVPTYIPPVDAVEGKDADVTTHTIHNLMPWGQNLPPTTNSPAIPAQAAIPGHWYNKRVSVDDGSDSESQPQPAAAALQQPKKNPLMFIGTPGGQNQVAPNTTGQISYPSAAGDTLSTGTQSAGVTIKDNATGKSYIYKGDPKDVPTDKYTIVQ